VSILTTAPLKVWPAAADSITVASGAGAGVLGAWVEIIPAGSILVPISIAGVCAELFVSALTNGQTTEIQFGLGTAGTEVSISDPLIVVASAGNLIQEIQMFLVPIGGIPAGARLAMRSRTLSGNIPSKFALMYYESLDEDPTMLAHTTYAPYSNGSNINGASVTPSGTAWANSSWVEFIDLGASSALLGVGLSYASGAYDGIEYEVDLGAGDAGSEVVLTTLRGTFSNIGVQGYMDLWLPTVFPISDDTRIAFRLRKAGTSTTATTAHLLYVYAIPSEDIVIDGLSMLCDVGQLTINGSGFTDTMTIAVQGPSGVLAYSVISIAPTQIVLGIDNLVTGVYCVDLSA